MDYVYMFANAGMIYCCIQCFMGVYVLWMLLLQVLCMRLDCIIKKRKTSKLLDLTYEETEILKSICVCSLSFHVWFMNAVVTNCVHEFGLHIKEKKSF